MVIVTMLLSIKTRKVVEISLFLSDVFVLMPP